MDDAERRELRALRARAYGPDADIHSDPAAWARLHELEGPSRSATPAAPAADPGRAATQPVAVVDDEGAETDVPDEPRPAGRPARRTIVLWAASVLVAALVGGVVGVQAAPADPGAPGARSLAALPLDEGFEPPFWMNGDADEVRGFREFHGLVPVATPADWTAVPTEECLVLFTPNQLGGETSGPGLAVPGCASGPFSAVVSLSVARDSPPELRDAFAEGTALQFVLDGDAVRVSVASPVEP